MHLSSPLLSGLVKKPPRYNNATVKENRRKDLKRVLATEELLKKYTLRSWNSSKKYQKRQEHQFIAKDNRKLLSELSGHERTVQKLKTKIQSTNDNL